MDPLVSVILPVYNRENTLKRAINSVLNQTYKNIELIIVDDASTDDSLQIAKAYLKDGVKVLTLSENVGAAEARNCGMKAAKGEYIAFQDSDDEWFPEKLSVQINYMTSEDVLVSFCPYLLQLDENICRLWPDEGKIQIIKRQGIHAILHKENVVGTPTLVMNKSVMEKIGFFDNTFPSIEDYDYVIRISKEYKMGFLERPLMKAYRQKISITTDTKAYCKGAEMLIAKHSDFLDLESRIKGTILFRTLEYEYEFVPGMKRIRKGYAKGDSAREKYLDDAIVRNLAKTYIAMKKVEICQKKGRVLNLRTKKFAIYGIGNIGKSIYCGLKQKRLVPQLFIVSNYHDDMKHSVDGIEVMEISKVDDKNLEIIVAVALETQEEILNVLNQYGFYNYFILDDPSILEDDSIFLEK